MMTTHTNLDGQTHKALYDAWANAQGGPDKKGDSKKGGDGGPLVGTDLPATLRNHGQGGRGMGSETATELVERLVELGLVELGQTHTEIGNVATYTITRSGCVALGMRVPA